MVIFQIVNNIALDVKGGGAEAFAMRLVKELSAEHKCHLIVVWKYNTAEEERLLNSMPNLDYVHFLMQNKKNKVISFVSLYRKLSSLIRQYNPEVINSHSALPDLLNGVDALFNRKSVHVRTMHTDINWTNNQFLNWLFVDNIFPLLFDCEVSISEMTKTRLDRRFFSRKLNKNSPVIYNGIPDISKHIREHNDFLTNPSIIKLVSVGRLSEQKDLHNLLLAIQIFKNKNSVKLTIVGDGPLKQELQEEAEKLGISEEVEFAGYRTDALDIIADSDIFVSSSLWEGFPTVILEAMAIGIPVIATDIPGSNELIINRKTGILVPPRNSAAIADAIGLLISTPNLAEHIVNNAQKSVNAYSMRAVADAYSNLYEKLVLPIDN